MKKPTNKLTLFLQINTKTRTIHRRTIEKIIKAVTIGRFDFLIVKSHEDWLFIEATTGLVFFKAKKLPILTKLYPTLKPPVITQKLQEAHENLNNFKRNIIELI